MCLFERSRFRRGVLPITTLLPLLLLSSPTISNAEQVTVLVPRHVVIPVILTKDLRVGGAGDARQTKSVKAEVAQDIVVNGYLIAKQGDLAEGELTTEKNVTKRAFSTDTSQEASLDIVDIVNFCGDTIHLEFERTYVGGVRAGFLSFGPHAHDAVFAKGSVLKAQTDRMERSICAEKTSAPMLPLPTDMVVPDEEVDPK